MQPKNDRKRKRNVLLLAGLGALGGAGVVADLLSEAYRHGDVAVVHGDHGHLLSGGSVRDAKTPDVRLKKEKEKKVSMNAVFFFPL